MSVRRTITPLLVGALLGVIQTGLFLQLSFTLASSFGTYLLVTICWLAGSVIGVWWLRRVSVPLVGYLAVMLVAYGMCALLLDVAPFETDLWLVYGVLIVLTGVYPGVFFGRMATHYRARDLFFMENNGFILGIIAVTILFMLVGRIALWAPPVLLGVILSTMGNDE